MGSSKVKGQPLRRSVGGNATVSQYFDLNAEPPLVDLFADTTGAHFDVPFCAPLKNDNSKQ